MNEMMLLERTLEEREKLFVRLYKNVFPVVTRHVSKMGGSLEEAKDVFHDALIIYYEKMKSDNIQIGQSEEGYILGICRHLWSKNFREKQRQDPLDEGSLSALRQEEIAQPSVSKLLRFLQESGKKCMELLQSFYYEKLSAEELAERFGYSGIRSATVQKFKCLEKVRNEIKKQSMRYEDFIE